MTLIFNVYTGEIWQISETIEASDSETRTWFIAYLLLTGVMGITITIS
jgi:predicted benzoate:H+ symporter BenE